MRWSLLAAISVSPFMLSRLPASAPRRRPKAIRVTGPVAHENLAVYFIHGPSAPGKVPLTLEEALAKRVVQVRETGNVNQLEIENLGNDEVFIQSGDIVKGGQQDRTLMVSLVLPPKSGRDPDRVVLRRAGPLVGARPRGREELRDRVGGGALARDEARHEGAEAGAGRRCRRVGARRRIAYAAETSVRQSEVWDGVRKMQGKLTGSLGGSVASAQSASSLQLALENEKLVDAQKAYIKALKAAGEADDDIVGYVFAVNGKLNSADVYPSNGLFRKMWAKLLNASAIEAIGHKDEARDERPRSRRSRRSSPTRSAARRPRSRSIAGVPAGHPRRRQGLSIRDRPRARRRARRRWVHRNYLAK